MSFNRLEKIITKTGIMSLAALAIIGVIASIVCALNIDVDVFSGTAIEDIFYLVLVVLSILVGFCFPVSFLMNISSIAASLGKRRNELE